MKRLLSLMLGIIIATTLARAQYDYIRPVTDEIPRRLQLLGIYPTDYYYTYENTPVIIFLHGQSLCARHQPCALLHARRHRAWARDSGTRHRAAEPRRSMESCQNQRCWRRSTTIRATPRARLCHGHESRRLRHDGLRRHLPDKVAAAMASLRRQHPSRTRADWADCPFWIIQARRGQGRCR